MLSRHLIAFAAAVALIAPTAHADTIRLSPGQPLARIGLLKPSVHRYLRYIRTADGARNAVDIWTRQVSFGPAAGGGASDLHIVQRWDRIEGKVVVLQDSWFEPRTFRPRTHVRRVERDGATTVGGYRFGDDKVSGMADLADNSRADFVLALPEAAYNFEYDMEFLQALPLAAGRTFDIPFYDPGVGKPGRYNFVVAGADRIPGPDGRLVDCWLVTADYNTGQVAARFWFAKAGQVLLREEQPMKDGGTMIKMLLPTEAEDLA